MRKVLLFLLLVCLSQQTHALAHISGEELSTAANKILNSLDDKQRAKACFEKQGVSVDMFPVDFRYYDNYFNLEKTFIPNENAWAKWSLIIHELTGFLIYKAHGYA